MQVEFIYVSPPAVGYSMKHTFDYTVTLFGPSAALISKHCLLRLLLTSHSSLLLRLTVCETSRDKSVSLSSSTCLIYVYGLRLHFWTLLPYASLSAANALLSGFCPSGYNFAIPSSRPHLTMQTLGVAIRFVGNYALVDFHHRLTACPSYAKKQGCDDPCL